MEVSKVGMTGLRRLSAIALAVMLVPTASAFASDELLSGYGGPGGGEQLVIGTKLVPPASGAGGSSQGTQGATSGSQQHPPSGSGSDSEKSSDSGQPSSDEPATPKRAGSKVVYQRETQSASTLPLASDDVLLLLAGAGIVGLIAFFFRRSGSADQ